MRSFDRLSDSHTDIFIPVCPENFFHGIYTFFLTFAWAAALSDLLQLLVEEEIKHLSLFSQF